MEPMWLQVQQITDLIKSIVDGNESFANGAKRIEIDLELNILFFFSKGYHFLGHSQGALLLRSIIMTWNEHMVDQFVTMAGLHLGEYVSLKEIKRVSKWQM